MPTDVILTLEKVSKQIGDLQILTDISFGIHSEDKIGILGLNGSGKTTFLKLISSQIEPSEGRIILRKGIKIGYLMQDAEIDESLSSLDFVMHGTISEESVEEHEAKAALSTLGLVEYDKAIGLLSGGQRRKADLARVLVHKPELLILDEPTNHLDLDTIEWLQTYLATSKITLIFVTHDRYFLDAVCNRVLEIERSKAYIYEGNYSEYVKAKLLRETDLARKETRRHAQLKKELDWLGRGARARSTKPKNHVDRVKELLSKSYLISNAELDISFQTARLGKTILELHRLSLSLGGKELFHNVDHNFQAKERIGIIGANGCGKTSLLRLITGDLQPDEGSIKCGINTRFAYYKQEEDSFNPNLSVYDYIAQYAEVIKTKDGTKLTASEMLQRFLFDGKMQVSKLSTLSGGERKRLFLLKALIFGANFIILDEPTNDLDIKTLEILEDYLDAFDGCLLVVSHDRYFLDRTVDYLFVFEPSGIRKFAGNYSDYLLVKRYEIEEKEEKAEVIRPKRLSQKLSFKEQRELEALESEIAEIEGKIDAITLRLHSGRLSPKGYLDISQEMDDLEDALEAKTHRWLELSDKY